MSIRIVSKPQRRVSPAPAYLAALFLLQPPVSNAALTQSGDVFVDGNGVQVIGGSAPGAVDVFGGDPGAAIGSGELGRNPGATGALTVRGSSAAVIEPLLLPGVIPGTSSNDRWLVIGLGGDGALAITEGSSLSGPRWVPVGTLSGSTSSILVDGSGSTLDIGGHLDTDVFGLVGGIIPQHGQGFLSIGPRGTGTVDVTNGGRINVTQVAGQPTLVLGFGVFLGGEVGGDGGGTGSLHVSGAGSRVDVSGDNAALMVGSLGGNAFDVPGDGHLTITDGGAVTVGGGSFFTIESAGIGAFEGTNGTATVDGTGSVLDGGDTIGLGTNGTLFDADPANDIAGGTGTLTVRNGGRVEADFGVFVGPDGTLQGDGTFGGGIFTSGGTIAPGNSPGDLTVIGPVDLSEGGVIEIEIDSATVFDRILATGAFDLGGGMLRFLFGPGVDPTVLEQLEPGAFLQRIAFEGDASPTPGLAGSDILGLDTAMFAGFAPGFDVTSITFDSAGGFTVSARAVPLPGPVYLLLSALGCLVLRARRHPASPLQATAPTTFGR